MKVKDLIKDSAVMLNLGEVVDILEDGTKTDAEKQSATSVAELVKLTDLSIRELCSHYMPVLSSCKITTTNKTYPLSSINNFIRMESASIEDKMVDFKIINRVLVFEADGTYDIEYASYPNINNLDDDVSFLQNFGIDVAEYGLCAYYCLTKGLFDELDNFYQRYIKKCETLKDMKTFIMPQRRWE